MKSKLGLFWWVGFNLCAFTTIAAAVVGLTFKDQPPYQSTTTSEKYIFDNYEAWWPDEEFDQSHDCLSYASCVYIVVSEIASCNQDVLVAFTVTDEQDIYLGEFVRVLERKDFKSSQPFEVGSDSPEVFYFAIDNITCGSGVETALRSA